MSCEQCAYGKYDVERRKQLLGDDCYQPEYCWCEKVGGKHFSFGYCEEALDLPPADKPRSSRKVRGRASRQYTTIIKDKRLRRTVTGQFNRSIWLDWDRIDGTWQPVGQYFKRPKNSNLQRYYKKHSNRIVRHYKGIGNYNSYRKAFDYWHTID